MYVIDNSGDLLFNCFGSYYNSISIDIKNNFYFYKNCEYLLKDIIYNIYDKITILKISNKYYIINHYDYKYYSLHNIYEIIYNIDDIINIGQLGNRIFVYLTNKVYELPSNELLFTYEKYINSFDNILHYNDNKCIIFNNDNKLIDNVSNIGYNCYIIGNTLYNETYGIKLDIKEEDKYNILSIDNKYNIIDDKIKFYYLYFNHKINNTKYKISDKKLFVYIGYTNIYKELNTNNYYELSYMKYNKISFEDYKLYEINKITNIKSARK